MEVQMDTKLIETDEKVNKSCDQSEETQKEDTFDVGFRRTCLVSGIIFVVLIGIWSFW